jgi:hypothetical protein
MGVILARKETKFQPYHNHYLTTLRPDSGQFSLYCTEYILHSPADILNDAIDKEPGGRSEMAATSTVLVLAHPLTINLIVHFGRESGHVQAEALRMRLKVASAKVIGIAQQQIVHRPELSLRRGRLRSFGGHERVRVRVFQGEVAEDELKITGVSREQLSDRRLDRVTYGAFKVRVLDYDHARVVGASAVIDRRDRHGQRHRSRASHVSTLLCIKECYPLYAKPSSRASPSRT